MSRKLNVIKDELGVNGSGIYAIMPFESLEKKTNKTIFKVGMTTEDMYKRIDTYHGYFPMGVYLVMFLANPPIPKQTRYKNYTKKKLYLEIENYIHSRIITYGGDRIYSTARIKNQNSESKGATEYFYADYEEILYSFKDAEKLYGGELSTFELKDVNYRFLQNKRENSPYYEGTILYPHK